MVYRLPLPYLIMNGTPLNLALYVSSPTTISLRPPCSTHIHQTGISEEAAAAGQERALFVSYRVAQPAPGFDSGIATRDGGQWNKRVWCVRVCRLGCGRVWPCGLLCMGVCRHASGCVWPCGWIAVCRHACGRVRACVCACVAVCRDECGRVWGGVGSFARDSRLGRGRQAC